MSFFQRIRLQDSHLVHRPSVWTRFSVGGVSSGFFSFRNQVMGSPVLLPAAIRRDRRKDQYSIPRWARMPF